MPHFEKTAPTLIRDKVPELMAREGKTYVCERAAEEDVRGLLHATFLAAVNEYLEKGTVEELADIGEVMHAILAYENIPLEEFQRVRLEKLEAQGGFTQRLLRKKTEG